MNYKESIVAELDLLAPTLRWKRNSSRVLDSHNFHAKLRSFMSLHASEVHDTPQRRIYWKSAIQNFDRHKIQSEKLRSLLRSQMETYRRQTKLIDPADKTFIGTRKGRVQTSRDSFPISV